MQAVLIAFCLLAFCRYRSYHSADAGLIWLTACRYIIIWVSTGAVLADYALTGFGLAARVFVLLIPLIWAIICCDSVSFASIQPGFA